MTGCTTKQYKLIFSAIAVVSSSKESGELGVSKSSTTAISWASFSFKPKITLKFAENSFITDKASMISSLSLFSGSARSKKIYLSSFLLRFGRTSEISPRQIEVI